MRSWMIGLLLGLLPVLLLPQLPAPWVAAVAGACGLLLLWRRQRRYRFGAGLALGCALALTHGQLLVSHRITEACVGQPLTLTRGGGGPAASQPAPRRPQPPAFRVHGTGHCAPAVRGPPHCPVVLLRPGKNDPRGQLDLPGEAQQALGSGQSRIIQPAGLVRPDRYRCGGQCQSRPRGEAARTCCARQPARAITASGQ